MAVETTTFSNNCADTWFRDIMSDCVLCPRACHVNRLAGQTMHQRYDRKRDRLFLRL